MSISSDLDYLVPHNQDFHTNPKLNLKTPLCNISQISFNGQPNGCFCGMNKQVQKERKQNQKLKQYIMKKEGEYHPEDFLALEKKKELYILKKENEQLELQSNQSKSITNTHQGSYYSSVLSQNNHYLNQLQQNQAILVQENKRLTKILVMRLKTGQR